MTDERFKAWITFWQFFLGTVVLGVFSAIISNQIQTREVEIKEQEANAKFLEQALQEDVGVRRRLAQYFSHVTRSKELRERWGDYAKVIESEYQDTLAEKKRLEQEAANKNLDAATKDRLNDRIAQLERELSPKPASSTTGISPRVYVHIAKEEQREAANGIADALKATAVAVPGVELKGMGPKVTELRYFKQAERDEAEHIAATIRTLRPDAVARYVGGYENSNDIRPRHFELWMAAPAVASSGASPAPVPRP